MTILKWDSDFFGFKVAKEVIKDDLDLQSIISESCKNEVKLVYLFSRIKINTVLEENDIKITYSQELLHYKPKKINFMIEEYSAKIKLNNILPLVYQSGLYSRFNLDKNISDEKFKLMYKQWFLKSITKELADKVFIALDRDEIIGFITLKVRHDNVGIIGLLAVSENWRSKGVANDLLNKTFNFLFRNGIKTVQVVTQGINPAACRFYEKNGFNELDKQYIYHLWIDKELESANTI